VFSISFVDTIDWTFDRDHVLKTSNSSISSTSILSLSILVRKRRKWKKEEIPFGDVFAHQIVDDGLFICNCWALSPHFVVSLSYFWFRVNQLLMFCISSQTCEISYFSYLLFVCCFSHSLRSISPSSRVFPFRILIHSSDLFSLYFHTFTHIFTHISTRVCVLSLSQIISISRLAPLRLTLTHLTSLPLNVFMDELVIMGIYWFSEEVSRKCLERRPLRLHLR
jgi:hypothetical protein